MVITKFEPCVTSIISFTAILISYQGTADFMSIEVYKMGYKFRARADTLMPIIDDNAENGWDLIVPAEILDATYVDVPWFYNPLHDLESLFWLIAYYVLSRDIYLPDALEWPPPFEQESDATRAARITAQYLSIEPLFIVRDQNRRADLLTSFEELKRQLASTPLHPVLFKTGQHLVAIRESLHLAYIEAEKSLPIPLSKAPTIAGGLYQWFSSNLHGMRRNLMDNNVSHVQCRPLSAVYEMITAAKVVADEGKKRTQYQLSEEFHIQVGDEMFRRIRASRTANKDTDGSHPVPSAPLYEGLRRSRRIAARVHLERVDEDRPEEDSANEPHRTWRRTATKPSIRNVLGKRKRGNDERDVHAESSRKVSRTAINAPYIPAPPPKTASRPTRTTRQQPVAPKAQVNRVTRKKKGADSATRPDATNGKRNSERVLRSRTRT